MMLCLISKESIMSGKAIEKILQEKFPKGQWTRKNNSTAVGVFTDGLAAVHANNGLNTAGLDTYKILTVEDGHNPDNTKWAVTVDLGKNAAGLLGRCEGPKPYAPKFTNFNDQPPQGTAPRR